MVGKQGDGRAVVGMPAGIGLGGDLLRHGDAGGQFACSAVMAPLGQELPQEFFRWRRDRIFRPVPPAIPWR